MNAQLELRHLRYFLAVAEELHFGRAAQKLHIAQPPLSKQIRQLEEMLDYPVFRRTSRSVQLTPAGEALLASVRNTLRRLDEDLERIKNIAGGKTGTLQVGFVSSAILTSFSRALRLYRASHPNVLLKLQELHTAEGIAALRKGEIQVAVLRDPDPAPDLHFLPLLKEPFCVIFPKDHALGRYSTVPLEKLQDEPMILFPASAGKSAWALTMRLCEKRGFRPKIAQEAPHWQTIVGLVASGLGLTLAPRCIAAQLPAGAESRPVTPNSTTVIHLAYSDSSFDPLTASFCSTVQQHFRRQQPPTKKKISTDGIPIRRAVQK